MLPIARRQIRSRCGLDTGRPAYTVTAQELQQLRHITPLNTSGLGANALVLTPTAVLVPLDVHVAQIGQRYTALREPAVERQCVQYFDVDDARCVLLVNQRRDKRAQIARKPTTSAGDKRRRALIRASHGVLRAGGSARQEESLCPVR